MKVEKPSHTLQPRHVLMGAILITLVIFGYFGWRLGIFNELLEARLGRASSTTPTGIQAVTPRPGATDFSLTGTPAPETPQGAVQPGEGMLILSLRDGNYNHLFAWNPQVLPLTRLTASPWDDIHPAVSPDGTRVAYASRANGYWDLYILDLSSGNTLRLTDTPEYDGSPSWSPDGQWIAYETYTFETLQIHLRSAVDPDQASIPLTSENGFNFSPAWSPGGREIAFVSTRSGEEEIWLARLDSSAERFINLSRSPRRRETAPAYSPDSSRLAWSSEAGGISLLMVLETARAGASPMQAGGGSRPRWSPDGSTLSSVLETPERTFLSASSPGTGKIAFPPLELPGSLYGMDWGNPTFSSLVQQFSLPISRTPEPLWSASLSAIPQPPAGRFGVVPLENVSAPYPYLHDAVNESFQALRLQTERETGWNYLDSLDSAFQPLTQPRSPQSEENWLSTGRAFAVNSTPLFAGWVVMVREDYNGQTYWRLYVRTRYQDGSQGLPLRQTIWDMSARYAGSPQEYEDGGRTAPVPPGYWIDFTELALRYGWKRVPALHTWRTYYAAARFNQYILDGGLDWASAMAEVYPPEALATVTPVPSRTPSPSPTPEGYWTQTPSPQPSRTSVPTLHPSWTPLP